MNIEEMHIAVNMGVDVIASHINNDFQPQEIDYYLNKAIHKYIKEQYSIIKTQPSSIESQYATENLRTLINSELIESVDESNHPNSYSVELPSDYEYFIQAYAYNDEELGPKICKFINYSEFEEVLTTQSNEPYLRSLPVTLESNNLIIVSEEDKPIESVMITYLESPEKVVHPESGDEENCNLPSHTHEDIVDLAVHSMLRDLQRRSPDDN